MGTQSVGLFNGPRAEMELDWLPVRTVRGGTRAMREAGEAFTPKTAREQKERGLYEKRLATSVMHEVYDETIAKIAGAPFEKPPAISGALSMDMQRIVEDADREGSSLSVFAQRIYEDAVNQGLGLFLVDNVPTVREDGTTMTLMEAEEADARPYFARIAPDNLLGFRSMRVLGRNVCTELRVREDSWEEDPAGGPDLRIYRVRQYTQTDVTVWRAVSPGTAGWSRESTFQVDSTGILAEWVMESQKPHGFPNNQIPLVVVYTKRCGFMMAKPPLLGLAQLNIKHWNQQSVHDSTLKYCLAPTLFAKGLTQEEKETKPTTGEGSALMSTSDDAELRYVEIAGTSLQASERQIEITERRMAARSVEPLMAGSATATGEVRSEMKEQSRAQQWIEGMEWGLWRGFMFAASWRGESLADDFNISLHRASSLLLAANPVRTQALQSDIDGGRLTLATYLKERARSGDFADDFDPEAEAQAIEERDAEQAEARMEAMAKRLQEEEAKQKVEPEMPPQPPMADKGMPDGVPPGMPPKKAAA